MSSQILTHIADQTATVTLSNPGKLNAIDAAMWRALREAIDHAVADPEVRCIVLRGEGDKAFAAGGDLEEFLSVRATVDDAMHYHEERVARALDAIRNCPKPTIAAIQGACIGGGLEIAGCCDIRIAGESARFGAPINKLGFSMYPGEMAGLVALAGPAVVLEILLEGRILDAHEAFARGLLSRIVPDGAVFDEARASARRIAAGAPLVASWHKQWIARLMHDHPLSEEEKRSAFAFLDTEDYREGMAAFFEKRNPVFKGR
ncbi:MAG: enoyl-CoA hydratase/isomerase family protein [Azoarcus sp.]|jgi:enoyl-CoA hydratase/carnithine racemase|nr:enoyl-CoA hydratase/isomerase family protein [Azoarcus sp.]